MNLEAMVSANIQASLAALHQDIFNFEKTVVNLVQRKMPVTQHPIKKQFHESGRMSSRSRSSRGDNPKNSHKISRKTNSSKDSQASNKLSNNPIAIVGMSGIFPGAKDLSAYWDNILREADCLSEVPASRWDAEAYYDPDPFTADKTYCKRGGFISDIGFDPLEFGLPPNILEATDVSQLLSLVIARDALKDAGYAEKAFDREATGVVLGTVSRQTSGPLWARLQYPVWERVLESSGLTLADRQAVIEKMKLAYAGWQENSFPGMLSNVVAGRIANRFDFGGLNCTLDAACASSLAALKMAISELVEHRADMMLAGGADPDNSIFTYLCFSKTPALSRQQMSRPFDADSDGIMLGEGAGMVVLKRLADAERAGDRIYAVIRGLGTSSDGRARSIYAPRPAGQLRALKRAYRDADVDPSSVGLLEAHGTGTPAGDVAEFESLKGLFEGSDVEAQSIALGSVKSQIGHTKTAAGMAGIIKVSLALHHKVLPPTINISKPNPKLNIESSPFYLNAALRPWIQPLEEAPRRAGVSSFGFGGTNFHVVLEEYQTEQAAPYRVNSTGSALLMAAETTEQLLAKCEQMREALSNGDSSSDSKEAVNQRFVDFVAASRTQQIATSDARVGFVAEDVAEAVSKLKVVVSLLKNSKQESWEHPQGIFFRSSGRELGGKVVALFPGQGSQYLEMGRSLAVNFPEIRQAYAQMDSAMREGAMRKDATASETATSTASNSVVKAVYPPPVFAEAAREAQVEKLQQTEFAQPAIGAFSVGLYRIFRQAGFKADFAAGHSFGELTALWAAGVVSDDDYGKLVRSRAQAMAMSDATDRGNIDKGTMLAVKGDLQQLKTLVPRLEGVEISNINSPQQAVLAGAKVDIAAAEKTLKAAGFSPMALPVAAAFHTQRVSYAQKSFGQGLQSVTFRQPKVPVYSNVTGQAYPQSAADMRELLQQQVVCPVEFQQEIENIYAAGGRCFVEFGPKRVLTSFVEEILGDRPYTAVALNASRRKDSDLQLREAAVRLRVEGLLLQEIDPYTLPPAETAKANRKKMDVPINGSSYISEKTKLAFEQALLSRPPVKIAAASYVSTVEQAGSTVGRSERIETNGRVEIASNGRAVHSHTLSSHALHNGNGSNGNGNNGNGNNGNGNNARTPMNFSTNGDRNSNGSVLSIAANNNGSGSNGKYATNGKVTENELSITDRYFHSEELPKEEPHKKESFRSPAELQAAVEQTAAAKATEQILQSLERTLSQFGQCQSRISTVHERYLENHRDYTQGAQQLTQQRQSLVFGTAPERSLDSTILESSERSLMAFHTHQKETARVHGKYLEGQISAAEQIFALGQQTYQVLTEDKRQAPTQVEQRATPRLEASVGKPSTVELKLPAEIKPPVAEEVGEVEEVEEAVNNLLPLNAEIAADADTVEVDTSVLESALLEITGDKTGYPVEMLELDMDMEADLGIDSLKRVEIVGAFQDRFPDWPQPSMEALAEQELRTLAQVANYMKSLSVSNESLEGKIPEDRSLEDRTLEDRNLGETTASEDDRNVEEENREIADERDSNEVEGDERIEPSNESDGSVDLPKIQTQLLEIVSDKTGYPAEMLELDMDMEADLGIDSLKRVEIVGAFQDRFPDWPQPSMEALAEQELRTLAQVANYMQSLSTPVKKN